MTQLSLTRYSVLLTVQFLLLLLDLCVNAFSNYLKHDTHLLLIFFVIQDLGLILSLTTLFLSFFSTYLFQAGLVYLIYSKFCTVLYVLFLYIGLTLTLHIWTLNLRWQEPKDYLWTDGLQVVYVLQRTAAALHYHFYKRAALRISDSRFYKDDDWMNAQAKQTVVRNQY